MLSKSNQVNNLKISARERERERERERNDVMLSNAINEKTKSIRKFDFQFCCAKFNTKTDCQTIK